MEFRIDIVKGNDGIILKVTADCRSVGDVAELIAALKLARHTLGPPADVAAKVRGGVSGGLARAAALSPTRRSEIASEAAKKRWKK